MLRKKFLLDVNNEKRRICRLLANKSNIEDVFKDTHLERMQDISDFILATITRRVLDMNLNWVDVDDIDYIYCDELSELLVRNYGIWLDCEVKDEDILVDITLEISDNINEHIALPTWLLLEVKVDSGLLLVDVLGDFRIEDWMKRFGDRSGRGASLKLDMG